MMQARTSALPRALLILLSCPIIVVLCIAFVDRAAATLAHADLAGRNGIFIALTHIVDPIPLVAGLGLVLSGSAALLGWRPGPVARTLIACCLATLVAIALKDELKFAFGRLWPETWTDNNPSWIRDGAYGFFPFHGRQGWSSFPSGHTTVITAPIAALWGSLTRWRLVLAIPVVLVMVGLLGADYHFIGDMVAGLYLGAACGTGAAVLLRVPSDPAAVPMPS